MIFDMCSGNESYIKINKADLQRRFNEYNRLYFDNVLPECELKMWKMNSYGAYAPYGKHKIYINPMVCWTEDSLRSTLVHEMIHLYVCEVIKPKFYVFPHGFLFKRMSWKIRRKYGFKVGKYTAPRPLFINEKAPTTWLGKLLRRL